MTEPLKTGIDELLTELDALVAREQSLLAALREVGGAAAAPVLTKATAALPRTFRLTTPLMAGPDVKAFQRLLNARFEAWGIHARLLEDGHFGASTRHVARQVALGLGLASADWAHGITPSMRVLIRTPSRRSAEQVQRAQARRGWLGELRACHATATPAAAPEATAKPATTPAPAPAAAAAAKPAAQPSPAPAAPQGLAAAILAHGGRYEEIVVREAQRSGLAASLICAVLEVETGFRNVFGHDAVANPIKSPPPPAPDLEVTRSRYRSYLQHRKAGQGNQGVGPMQLTSPDLQDRADRLGGAWRPAPNIRVGVELLAANIKRLGLRQGVRAYNGPAGSSAEGYATKVLERERIWRARLEGHAANGHDVPAGGPPRTFRLTSPAMAGPDVKAFQQLLNARFDAWGIHVHVVADGEFGANTRHAARRVALGLGLTPADFAPGITPAARVLIRTPSRRSPEQVQRAQARRGWLGKLRALHADDKPS